MNLPCAPCFHYVKSHELEVFFNRGDYFYVLFRVMMS
jgi:hypothetical protein